eukprot:scaffold2572_cov391-Prasinococcus_capsulatus_cf.AAC.3
MSSQMLEVDYADSFTDAFSLANKAADFLMFKEGREVCDWDGKPEDYNRYQQRMLEPHAPCSGSWAKANVRAGTGGAMKFLVWKGACPTAAWGAVHIRLVPIQGSFMLEQTSCVVYK